MYVHFQRRNLQIEKFHLKSFKIRLFFGKHPLFSIFQAVHPLAAPQPPESFSRGQNAIRRGCFCPKRIGPGVGGRETAPERHSAAFCLTTAKNAHFHGKQAFFRRRHGSGSPGPVPFRPRTVRSGPAVPWGGRTRGACGSHGAPGPFLCSIWPKKIQAKVTTVPVLPSRASMALSRLVMMAFLLGFARTNFMAACTLGSMLPGAKWPSST